MCDNKNNQLTLKYYTFFNKSTLLLSFKIYTISQIYMDSQYFV